MPSHRNQGHDDWLDAIRYVANAREDDDVGRWNATATELLYKEFMKLCSRHPEGVFTTNPDPEKYVAKPISELTGDELEERIRDVKRELKHEKNYNASTHLGRQLTELNTEKNKRKILHAKELARSEHALDDFLGGFKIN